jgi:hypothetical protein
MDKLTPVIVLVLNSAAFGQTPAPVSLAPVGLAASETAQVNIANTAVNSPINGLPAECGGSINFYSAAGTSLSTAFFDVKTGQTSSVTLLYAATGAKGTRTMIRAEITFQVEPGVYDLLGPPFVAPCTALYSFETYDSTTGVTHVFVSGTAAQLATSATGRAPSSRP